MSFELVGVRLVAQDAPQFNSAMASADKAVTGFGSTSSNTFRQLPGLADIATGALHRVGAMAVEVFAQAGAAAVGFLKDSIGVAADFETGMANFQVAVGDSLDGTSLKLEDFKNDFLAIGKELPVSTAEVQQAAVDLIKGGIDPLALHTGALKETIQFATAADIDLTKAADLSARQLGIWVDAAASGTEQAEFLAKAHNILVKTAGAATVGVDDLAKGMNIAGGQAKALNLDYQDFATAMALVAPAFNSTEEAGTSFKNFLARLQPSTKPAIQAMQSLGLYSEETGSAFFDAQGKFVGARQASELLATATKGLTDAQRASLLQTIFGNDAMGAAVRLAESGADGYDALSGKIEKASGVTEAAAAKQATFATAMDNFKGSVEVLQTTIGSLLLPVLTKLFNNYLAPGVNLLTDLAGALSGDSAAFARLTPAVQGFASGVSTAFTIVQNAIAAVQKKFATFQEVIRLWDSGVVSHKTLLQALGISPEIAGIIDQIIGKISGFVQYLGDVKTKVETAFKFDGVFGAVEAVVGELAKVSPAFALIKGAAEAAFPAVQQIVSDVFGIIETVIKEHGDKMLADVQSIWGGIWTAVQTVLKPLQDLVASVMGIVADAIHENGDDISSFIEETWDSIFEIIDTALKLISGVIAGVLIVVNGIMKEHGDEIKAIITNVWTIIKNVIGGALDIIKGILKAALKIFQGDWEGAWQEIKTMSENVVKRLWEIIKAGLDLIANLFGTTLTDIGTTWSHNWDTFKGMVSRGIDAFVKFFTDLPDTLSNVGSAIVDSIWNGLKERWDDFVGDLEQKLQDLKDMLPFSEPKDPSSPLRGLQKSGYSMVEQIQIGIDSFGPLILPTVQTRSGGSLDDLLGGSGVWGNSGGGGGGSGGGGSPWGNGLVAGVASAALAGLRGGASSITNNQQRTASITYNTAVAPPMSQSYAMAQALVGGF